MNQYKDYAKVILTAKHFFRTFWTAFPTPVSSSSNRYEIGRFVERSFIQTRLSLSKMPFELLITEVYGSFRYHKPLFINRQTLCECLCPISQYIIQKNEPNWANCPIPTNIDSYNDCRVFWSYFVVELICWRTEIHSDTEFWTPGTLFICAGEMEG